MFPQPTTRTFSGLLICLCVPGQQQRPALDGDGAEVFQIERRDRGRAQPLTELQPYGLLRDMLATPHGDSSVSRRAIEQEIQSGAKTLEIALKQLDIFIKQYTSLSSSLVLEDNANFLYRLRSAADLFRKKASAWAIHEHGADTKDLFQFKQGLGESEREFLELINNMIAIENLALQNSHQAANAWAVSVRL